MITAALLATALAFGAASTADAQSGCTIDGTLVETIASQAECDALIALYNSTDGPNWRRHRGWATTTDPCGWYGVTCFSGAVVGVGFLQLDRNGLSGPLPSQLGDLTKLWRLDLRDNNLTGPIPASLGNLASVRHLWLSGNQLSGPIPPEFSRLRQVLWLWLGENELTGPIPPELGTLRGVNSIILRENQLTGPSHPNSAACDLCHFSPSTTTS